VQKRLHTHHCGGKKLWILRMKKFLSLPCSLLLGMMAPLNLEELNHSTPRDPIQLTQNLH
jgi:hypothetical protein